MIGADLSRLERFNGMRLWTLSSGLAAVWLAVVFGTTSTGYVLALGGSNALVGLLAGANSWGHVLQLVSPLIGARLTVRKPLCGLVHALGYAVWALVALCAWLPASWPRAQLVIALAISGGMLIAIGSPMAQTWLADLVPGELRGRFVARQQSTMAAVGLLAGLLGAAYVDARKGPHQVGAFQILYFIGVAFALASVNIWMRVPEPPMQTKPGRIDPKLLALPFRNANFRDFTLFVSVRTLTMMMASPFFAVYMLETLQLSYRNIAIYGIAVTVCQIASNPFWGYLADKFGYKPLLRISTFGVAVIPLPWFFTTRENCIYIIPFVQMWAGVMGAGMVLAQYNLMLKCAPEEHKEVYIGVHTAMVNGAVGIGSILGGFAADGLARIGQIAPLTFLGRPLTNLHMLFLISSLLRLLGLSLLRKVREDPEVAARTVMREVSSGNLTRTLYYANRLQNSSDTDTRARATRALGAPGNVLAVEELITALDDSEREVRREAARALGTVADERAVTPLIAKAADPVADMAEPAIESLGKIGTEAAFWALVQLLDDSRDAVRRSAAQALAATSDARAILHLRKRLETETDPAVLLVVADALARSGDPGTVHLLRHLLSKLGNDAARKQLASSLGNLLGEPGEFYRLLELEPMRQEAEVQRHLEQNRRRLTRWRAATAEDRDYISLRLIDALLAFEHEDYTQTIALLRQAASRTLHITVAARPPRGARSGLSAAKQVGLLVEHDPVLRLNFGFLNALWRACRTDSPGREEALLAVFAFTKVAASPRRLRRQGPV